LCQNHNLLAVQLVIPVSARPGTGLGLVKFAPGSVARGGQPQSDAQGTHGR
jgi:hypothetical protein